MSNDDVQYHCCSRCQGLFASAAGLATHKAACTGDMAATDSQLFVVDRETFMKIQQQVEKTDVDQHQIKPQRSSSARQVHKKGGKANTRKPHDKCGSLKRSVQVKERKTKKKGSGLGEVSPLTYPEEIKDAGCSPAKGKQTTDIGFSVKKIRLKSASSAPEDCKQRGTVLWTVNDEEIAVENIPSPCKKNPLNGLEELSSVASQMDQSLAHPAENMEPAGSDLQNTISVILDYETQLIDASGSEPMKFVISCESGHDAVLTGKQPSEGPDNRSEDTQTFAGSDETGADRFEPAGAGMTVVQSGDVHVKHVKQEVMEMAESEHCDSPAVTESPQPLYEDRKDIHGNYTCEICPYKTRLQGMYKRHVATAHNDGQKFKCPTCHEEFVYRRLYKVHLNTHTGFRCDHCDKAFSRVHDKNRHVDQIHKEEKVAYKCNCCDYITSYKHTIKEHLRKHTGATIACPITSCKYRTIYRRSLQHHLNTVHCKTRKYNCQACQYKTNDLGYFTRHECQKKHRCRSCTFCAQSLVALRKHRKEKHVDTCYQCDKCQFSTVNKVKIQAHLRHHREVKIPCEYCSICTFSQEDMTKHVLEKHNKLSVMALPAVHSQEHAAVEHSKTNAADSVCHVEEVVEEFVDDTDLAEVVYHDMELHKDPVPDASTVYRPLYQCAFCPYSHFELEMVRQHISDSHSECEEAEKQDISDKTSGTNVEDAEYQKIGHELVVRIKDIEKPVILDTRPHAETEAVESILHLQNAIPQTSNVPNL